MTIEEAARTGGTALPGPAGTRALREAARAKFAASGLPTPRRETWRYTDLKPLAERAFDLAPCEPDAAAIGAAAAAIESLRLPAAAARIVLVDGHLVPALGRMDPSGPIELLDLHSRPKAAAAEARENAPEHPLAALNAAFGQAALWLRVRENARLAEPFEIVLVASGAPDLAPQPRILIDVGRGAELAIVQCLVDAERPSGWLNSVTQIEQAPDSRLTFHRVQLHAPTHAHTALLTADVAASASCSIGLVDLGGRLVRNDVDVVLRDRDAAVELYGVFLAGQGQHVDDHTRIDHLAPDTRSDEAFRGVIGRRGRGVFNGKVVVHHGAQRIDARQSNDNLLLSDQAEIDTKPELEIYADDVKCSHGSTVGELDAEHLFYLRSRGIDEPTAREILTTAFAASVLERIAKPELRDWIAERVAERLRALEETSS